MNGRLKKRLLISIGAIVLLLFGVFGINCFIENKLKKTLDNLPETIKIQYKKLSANVLSGHVGFEQPIISVYGKTTNEMNAKIALESLDFDGFGYIDYFFNDNIALDNIIISQPEITYFHNDAVKSDSYQDAFKNSLKQSVEIESLQIMGAKIAVYDMSKDSLMLKSKDVNVKVNALQMNRANTKTPIAYNDFSITCNDLFYKLSTYENLSLKQIDFKPKTLKFKGLSIKTKYTKEALSQMISVERDHFDLEIDSVVVDKQDFGFKRDSLFYFKSKRVDFYQPDFKIYRDKLVADDLSYKPLYSKMLRDLGFNLTLNSVFLNNTSIVYTEKVKADTQGGKLLFSKLQAEIQNLSNTYESDGTVTSVNVEAVFMDDSPINTQWEFDVNNSNDAFVFKAEIGKLNADSMNQFMKPNLNVGLEGEIIKTYFTIDGNDQTSHIDLKLQYDDFDVVVLKEDGKEKNKLLSTIVNIFVSKNSDKKSDDFRHGTKSDVERTENKSVFNYLWLNIKAGLLNAMTGNGKEK